jgi:hypothetical protein
MSISSPIISIPHPTEVRGPQKRNKRQVTASIYSCTIICRYRRNTKCIGLHLPHEAESYGEIYLPIRLKVQGINRVGLESAVQFSCLL